MNLESVIKELERVVLEQDKDIEHLKERANVQGETLGVALDLTKNLQDKMINSLAREEKVWEVLHKLMEKE